MPKTTFTINGKPISIEGPLEQRLLDILRRDLKLTGAKEGCGEGECGACSVFVNGKLMNSCLLPLANVEGKDVMTIEGYKHTQAFKHLETAFLKEGATQCGICTPGMIMASDYLLREHHTLTDEIIKHGLAGNLCRCTGYNMIIKAIKRAAKSGGDLWKKDVESQR